MNTLLILLASIAPGQPQPTFRQPLPDRPLTRVQQDRLRTILDRLRIRRIPALKLGMPKDPLYVGSYARIPIQINPLSGLAYDDLAFRVVEGPAGGSVSESKDATFTPARPNVVLIAGYKPSSYTFEVSRRGTSIVLARGTYKTSVSWAQKGAGPSFVQHGLQPFASSGSAWGGGPGGRQNVNVAPATGTRRIAMIFVENDEQAYPTGAAFDAIRDNWMNNIINGVNRGGITFSLRDYYRQTSNNRFDVSCQAFGPYDLGGAFNDVGPGKGWVEHAQAAITAADADIDYRNFDTVLVVHRTVDATATAAAMMAWPIASIGEWNGWVTADGAGVSLGSIQMPFDWTVRDGREVFATASHELGHNLGLGDMYTPAVAGRNPGDWELMHGDGALPEFSLAHKMMLGWVDEAWVTGFNFATSGTNIDQTITLSPTSAGAPAAGRFVGAEVRITDGLNYYFEHRRTDAARLGDRSLPTNDRVLGTDVSSAPYTPPIARPGILLMPTIAPSAGPILGNTDVYRETDTSSPVFPVDFTATASNFTGNTANLRIQYGINGKPDPSIRPWGAPPWQTDDIEVRNARNAVDAAWFNVPWQGNPNTVVAKIKNGGNVNAPNVQVNFFVKNYNVGGAPEAFLGSDTDTIGPGATVEFTTSWTPPTNGHYCIIARIPLYQTPAPSSIVELTELNNMAQSNYDRFISPTASPAERQITTIEVGNPYMERTRVFIDVQNTNPLYRTYIAHKWIDLDPGAVRKVQVMYEFVGKFPPSGVRGQDDPRKYLREENRVSIKSFITNPADKTGHVIEVLGGAGASIATGRKTEIRDFRVSDGRAIGRVLTVDRKPVSSGTILLTLITGEGRERKMVNQRAQLNADGVFAAPVRRGWTAARAYFVPSKGYGDATSPTVPIS